jgi:hypothetical protein
VSVDYRIEGVKQTIAELRRLDPEIRKAFNKNAKEIARPAIIVAQNRYKALQFPSGTYRKWEQGGREIFPLNPNKASRAVMVKVSGRKKGGAAIAIVNSYAGAGVFEFARNGNLGAAFNAKNGAPARVMWPVVSSQENAIAAEMARLIDDVSRMINEELHL